MSLVPKRNSLLRRPQNSRCSPEAVTFSGDSGLGHSLARQCLASTPPALGLGLPVLDGGAVQVPPPLNQVPAPASSLSRAQTLGLPRGGQCCFRAGPSDTARGWAQATPTRLLPSGPRSCRFQRQRLCGCRGGSHAGPRQHLPSRVSLKGPCGRWPPGARLVGVVRWPSRSGCTG